MDVATARWLTSDAARPALQAATAEPDPASLAAATRLRALVTPEQAAAVLTQAVLRRKAVAKFGRRAERLFFTPDGLEQATRAGVAARRASRFAHLLAAANHRALTAPGPIADLGCGLGADALAFADAGLDVIAVERDEVTAILAEANLASAWEPSDDEQPGATVGSAASPRGQANELLAAHGFEPCPRVEVGAAEERWPALAQAWGDQPLVAPSGIAVFCDPARRTASGRTWRVEDLTPPWSFVESLLDGSRVACVKLGPGIPHRLIPDQVWAEWTSEGGTVVECALWAGPGVMPGVRAAVVDGAELVAGRATDGAPVGPIEEYFYEPDGAVVRAGLVDELARMIRAHRVADQIAYLSAPWHMPTPFATAFRVREVLAYDEKVLRGWVREHGVGTLEIKKRGIDVDPAQLRKRLKPKGRAQATLILTPTASGAVAVVCERLR
ncbi:MAG: class I SAM-dependent methyltransferase [Propioniciclava sp.]|uniref:class I SAM-dependent methyltransferase n=1 Tax=Propioniciclava sp. TaxID=2038686 RepID=UPI0039E42231